MNWKRYLMLSLAVAALSFTSCSGKHSGTSGGGGNATVNVTLYDTPPTGTTILSFTLPVVGISLTPSTGSDVSIYSPTTPFPAEITHLQTDSLALVNSASVAPGKYTAMKITLGTSTGIFINASSSAIGTCVKGAVCPLPNGAATTVTVPLSVTLSSNVTQWIGLDVNLNNAIVTTSGNGIGIDFNQSNVFTATTTVRTGLPTGVVDTIEDFTGKVTALSNSSITVQNSITGQSLTAIVTSNTALTVAPVSYNTGCGNAASPAACIQVGSIVSMYANLAAAGTLTATEIDGLDTTATDEIEGVIYPTSTAGVVGLVLMDKTDSSGNAVLTGATYGTTFLLNATSNSITYSVDSGPLTSAPGFSTVGFVGTGSLLAGQVIRAQVSNVAVVNNINQATAVNVLLRWSRVSATVNATGGNAFTLTGIPTYMSSSGLNPSVPQTPQVNTYTNNTAFDGITGVSSLTVGSPVAIRALFLDVGAGGGAQYSFQAAKLRVP